VKQFLSLVNDEGLNKMVSDRVLRETENHFIHCLNKMVGAIRSPVSGGMRPVGSAVLRC